MQRSHPTQIKFMRQWPKHPRLHRSTTRTGDRQHPGRHSPPSGSAANPCRAAGEREQSHGLAVGGYTLESSSWCQEAPEHREGHPGKAAEDSSLLLSQLIQVLTVHPSLSYLSESCTVTSLGMGCSRKISTVNHDAAAPYTSSVMFPQPATLVQKMISNKAVKHLHCSVTTKIHVEFNQTGKRETGTFLIQAYSPIITMEL